MSKMFIVTVEWIHEHASYHGPAGNSWKKVQAEALGLTYPFKAGWIQRVEGMQITQEHRDRFEFYKDTAKRTRKKKTKKPNPDITAADWSGECENCGASPIVPATGMCGPCTFGEAETIGGNW